MGKDQEGEEDRQTEDRQGTGHRHNVGVGFTDKDNKGGMRTERDNNEGTVPAGVSLNASEGTGEKEEGEEANEYWQGHDNQMGDYLF